MLAALALATLAASPAPPMACPADSDLAYVCGVEKPEDVLALPGTDWLIASGFSRGAGIKLVDARTGEFRVWYDGARQSSGWDRRTYSDCPGLLDPALFTARGLGLRPIGPGRWQLLAVNHGGRESIEAFEIDIAVHEPRLTWRGCMPMPEGQVGNSVASFSDGTVLVTVLTRPGTSIGDFMLGRATGGVWQRGPSDRAFRLLPGTELPGNNGIEVDPGQRLFYVVVFGLHAVAIFDRTDTSALPEIVVAPDFMPDNIHWSGGRLILAGMRLDEPACGGLRKVVDGKADPMLCHRGWVVGELLAREHRIATVAYGRRQPGFNGLSAAAIKDNELWLGSFQSDRLARTSIESTRPLRPRQK